MQPRTLSRVRGCFCLSDQLVQQLRELGEFLVGELREAGFAHVVAFLVKRPRVLDAAVGDPAVAKTPIAVLGAEEAPLNKPLK